MTDRRQIEILAATLKAAGYIVRINHDRHGYIASIGLSGRTMSPLSFAERGREILARRAA